MEWSKNDIAILSTLLREGATIEEISEVFKRSRSAVIAAARKIMLQLLLHHPPEEVAKMYGFADVEEFRNTFRSDKYYVAPKDDNDRSIPTSFYMVLGLIVVSGIARFGMVLAQSPLLAQC